MKNPRSTLATDNSKRDDEVSFLTESRRVLLSDLSLSYSIFSPGMGEAPDGFHVTAEISAPLGAFLLLLHF